MPDTVKAYLSTLLTQSNPRPLLTDGGAHFLPMGQDALMATLRESSGYFVRLMGANAGLFVYHSIQHCLEEHDFRGLCISMDKFIYLLEKHTLLRFSHDLPRGKASYAKTLSSLCVDAPSSSSRSRGGAKVVALVEYGPANPSQVPRLCTDLPTSHASYHPCASCADGRHCAPLQATDDGGGTRRQRCRVRTRACPPPPARPPLPDPGTDVNGSSSPRPSPPFYPISSFVQVRAEQHAGAGGEVQHAHEPRQDGVPPSAHSAQRRGTLLRRR